VIMSSKMYGATQSARIAPVRHISDHCTMSLVFRVDDVSFNADWTLQTAHVCSSGGCGTNFVLKWNPERAGIYGEGLADIFFFWWGLLHGPQQGPDRMRGKKPIRLGKGKLLPKQKNPP